MQKKKNTWTLKKRTENKKTKVVATIGPASSDEKTLRALVDAGMSVARINFSHGDFAEHAPKVKRVRAISKAYNMPIAILQDLGGPKIRTGDFATENGCVVLKKGARFTFTTKKIAGDANGVSISYLQLPNEVQKGNRVLIDDGRKELVVVHTTKTDIVCRVVVGGEIKGRRGISVPEAKLSISSLTAKDKRDLAFAKKYDVDYVALSFVRRVSDVEELRRLLKKQKTNAKIIAKIETREAIENLEEIIHATDAVMVARGDLAVEIGNEQVPLIQKRIIRMCNRLGKPVITATQMLESMIGANVPTRAEVSDVANAILDGTDAVMLSEETALGAYPVASVQVMRAVANDIEKEKYNNHSHSGASCERGNVACAKDDIVSEAAVAMAAQCRAKAIIALTESGKTARLLSRFKPRQPIIAFTPNQKTYNQLSLSANCFGMNIFPFEYISDIRDKIGEILKKERVLKKGDTVVITAGIPFRKVGSTNTIMLYTIK